MLKSESERIASAGGWVTAQGRINGNLNLSRALGDLKYKGDKQLGRHAQIITAQPDVTVHTIEKGDEFFVCVPRPLLLLHVHVATSTSSGSWGAGELTRTLPLRCSGTNQMPTSHNISVPLSLHEPQVLTDPAFALRLRRLACDGVWDCMTNQQVVEFIRERIRNTPLSEICEAILDNCIADDPKTTGGIGGDNMTIVIVQLHIRTEL